RTAALIQSTAYVINGHTVEADVHSSYFAARRHFGGGGLRWLGALRVVSAGVAHRRGTAMDVGRGRRRRGGGLHPNAYQVAAGVEIEQTKFAAVVGACVPLGIQGAGSA